MITLKQIPKFSINYGYQNIEPCISCLYLVFINHFYIHTYHYFILILMHLHLPLRKGLKETLNYSLSLKIPCFWITLNSVYQQLHDSKIQRIFLIPTLHQLIWIYLKNKISMCIQFSRKIVLQTKLKPLSMNIKNDFDSQTV